MKLFVVALGVVSSVAIVAGSAVAADMPVKAAPPGPVAPAVHNWTGFYVGGNIGYGWGDRDVSYVPNDPLTVHLAGVAVPALPAASFNSTGILGGLQFGYNWQFNRNWLLGFETDFNWSDMKGSRSDNFNFTPGETYPFTAAVDEHIKWFGTVRARLGYLPSNNLLTFITGGFAYGRVDHTASMALRSTIFGVVGPGFSVLCAPKSTCLAGSTNYTATGWTLGGGLEYAFWQSWTFKAEYLYVSLDGKSVTETALMTFPGTSPASFNANFNRTNFNVVRVGLNYYF